MSTEEVFEQIVRFHHAMIPRIAQTYEAKTALVEDLVQDIYLAIWRALPAFRGESSLRTFVARIATKPCNHPQRARSQQTAVICELTEHLPAAGDNPERQAMALDRGARLASAVKALPLAYRQTALLALEGLTPKEIADVLVDLDKRRGHSYVASEGMAS
jgi:RNA polymerase sigma-70 factor (ECF subfamily)